MTSQVTWWWRPQYPTRAPSNFFVNQYIKNNSNWMCERSGFRWFHWFHWCFGELLMEVWSDPSIKSEPYSEGDHAKLCKYVKCGWIFQGPGIFKLDPIFRQELTYPGYLEIIYALLLATTFTCHIMNFRATFIVSRTLHPSNIGLPEKKQTPRKWTCKSCKWQHWRGSCGILLFRSSLFFLKNKDYPKGNDPLPTTNFQEQAYL